MAPKKRKGKAGPKTVFERDETLTIRVSGLFKQISKTGSERISTVLGHRVSQGDFVEKVVRKYGPLIEASEFSS